MSEAKFRAIDQYQKGRKRLTALSAWSAIQIITASGGIDLKEYDILFTDLAVLIDAIFVSAMLVFQLVSDDYAKLRAKYFGDMT